MPNDTDVYREDSFDNMQRFARQHGFTFPYVIDETQEIARAYGAQCTPDFFGFNADDELQYRARFRAHEQRAGRAARAVRGDGAGGNDRPRPAGADREHGLLDQVATLMARRMRRDPLHRADTAD
jgi:hypothetical protein